MRMIRVAFVLVLFPLVTILPSTTLGMTLLWTRDGWMGPDHANPWAAQLDADPQLEVITVGRNPAKVMIWDSLSPNSPEFEADLGLGLVFSWSSQLIDATGDGFLDL